MTHECPIRDLSCRKWFPTTTGPPGPSSYGNFVAIDGPPGPSMADYDCHRWSGLATSGPLVLFNAIHAINDVATYMAAFIGYIIS